jgi:hypothetical protein
VSDAKPTLRDIILDRAEMARTGPVALRRAVDIYCLDCDEREDRCVCGTEDDDCPICGEMNCCEDTHA